MPIWLDISILGIFSILAVPAALRAYSRLVRWRYPEDTPARSALLNWVRSAEQFWFRASPFVLIVTAAVALFFVVFAG